MDDGKKPKRRAYLDAFEKNAQGSYVYTGELYFWQGGETDRRHKMRILWLLSAALLSSAALSLGITAPGTLNCAYVLIPCAGSFLGSISVCWGMYRMSAGGNPLRAYIYNASVKQIPIRALCTCAGAAISIAGEIIYVLSNGMEEKRTGFLLFLLLEGSTFVTSLSVRRCIVKTIWKLQKKGAEIS